MTFDGIQQQQHNPERFAERSMHYNSSRRMSDEVHVENLDFHPYERHNGLHTQNILQSALESMGQKLWARTQFAGDVRNGNWGCAASVSDCLQRAGFAYANHAGVGGLVDQLLEKGWSQHPINEASPGDVIYGHKGGRWRQGGGNAHVGIMGENGRAFANSSGTGRWKEAPLEGVVGRRFGGNRFCLRPPGERAEISDQPERFQRQQRPEVYSQVQNSSNDGVDGTGGGGGSEGIDVIMNKRFSATEKLAAVQQLSHEGMTAFIFQGPDGQSYSMRTETESVGNREMVHLFITLPDGKERVVLRGIAQGDGSFQREQSADGRRVDFYGKGAGNQYPLERDQRQRLQRDGSDYSFDNMQPNEYSNDDSLNGIINDAQNAAGGRTNQLIRTPQGVYMRAGMDIDSDGSPRARQIDPTGQSRTSMRYTDGSSVNAEVVPYMVLPGGQYSQFGVKIGDMCLVRNRENGRVTVAVFADVGPRHKRGEGSMALAAELGINPSPTRGGISKPNIEYLVLPDSGHPVQNQQQLMMRIRAQRDRFGLS